MKSVFLINLLTTTAAGAAAVVAGHGVARYIRHGGQPQQAVGLRGGRRLGRHKGPRPDKVRGRHGHHHGKKKAKKKKKHEGEEEGQWMAEEMGEEGGAAPTYKEEDVSIDYNSVEGWDGEPGEIAVLQHAMDAEDASPAELEEEPFVDREWGPPRKGGRHHGKGGNKTTRMKGGDKRHHHRVHPEMKKKMKPHDFAGTMEEAGGGSEGSEEEYGGKFKPEKKKKTSRRKHDKRGEEAGPEEGEGDDGGEISPYAGKFQREKRSKPDKDSPKDKKKAWEENEGPEEKAPKEKGPKEKGGPKDKKAGRGNPPKMEKSRGRRHPPRGRVPNNEDGTDDSNEGEEGDRGGEDLEPSPSAAPVLTNLDDTDGWAPTPFPVSSEWEPEDEADDSEGLTDKLVEAESPAPPEETIVTTTTSTVAEETSTGAATTTEEPTTPFPSLSPAVVPSHFPREEASNAPSDAVSVQITEAPLSEETTTATTAIAVTTSSTTTAEDIAVATTPEAPHDPSAREGDPPTFSPTWMPTEEPPPCPPQYDHFRTDYVLGDAVEVREHVFECGILPYCNVAEWDDALLDEDPDARDNWNEAWVHMGPCAPTTIEELLEAEAVEVDWNDDDYVWDDDDVE